MALLGAVVWDRRESNIEELLEFQWSMEVPACGNRRWEEIANGVDGLEDTLKVTTPRNLFDEYRGQTLGAEFLVDAKEVHFRGVQNSLSDPELNRDGGDESHEFFGGRGTNANVPFFPPTRSFEGP